jgi:cell wall-associated NlpC family hydrolase
MPVFAKKSMTAFLLLTVLVSTGCTPKRVLCQPAPVAPPPAVAPPEAPGPSSGRGPQVAALAAAQVGRPYRHGGNQPHRGFDCSGLVQWSYDQVGVSLPRVVRDQSRVGRRVDARRLRRGDLVFFAIRDNRTSHVGIYVGEGRFVHAPRTGQPVRTDTLDDPYWRARWSDSRRVLDP